MIKTSEEKEIKSMKEAPKNANRFNKTKMKNLKAVVN